jgi:hypothetical protein
VNQSLLVELAPACRVGNVLASAKFLKAASFFHLMVLLMPSRPIRFFAVVDVARLSRSDDSAMANFGEALLIRPDRTLKD